MTVTVRFAPSPTGRLHVGNLRTALVNWLHAKRQGGKFILRLDDTDVARSTAEFAAAIEDDLAWLGLVWDRLERQSDRIQLYDLAAAQLKAEGRLYPCYETEDELDRRRKRQRARGLPPIYDRASLRLPEQARAAAEAQARQPHWRFRLANTDAGSGLTPVPTLVTWHDLVRGEQSVDVGSLSDPVLIREDGSYLYTFTSVVDDIDMGITHVIRGEDHVTNTGVQIQLFEALGAGPPAFAHHSLLVDADGGPLSKRLGSLSVAGLRDAGYEPMAIASHAALVGTSQAIDVYDTLDELAERFQIDQLSRAPARFDEAELRQLNARLLHRTPYSAVHERLSDLGVGGGEEFWNAVRGNIGVLADAAGWWNVVGLDVAPMIEDAAFCQAAAGLLPPEPWSAETWSQWTNAVKSATGRKGRQLFHPLRLALTGMKAGPELKLLLPLIGRARALQRLQGQVG